MKTKTKKVDPTVRMHPCEAYALTKEQNPEAIVLLRCGDFYETFGDDAHRIAQAVGLTITHRLGVPMAGFPYHQLDTYLRKLVQSGLRIAIGEQTEPLAVAVESEPAFHLERHKPTRPKARFEDVTTHQKPLFLGADDLDGQGYLFSPVQSAPSERQTLGTQGATEHSHTQREVP
jgi:hypothetical protein